MPSTTYITNALVMGFVLVAIVAVLARGWEWKEVGLAGGPDRIESLRTLGSNPLVWTIGFVSFSLVAGASAVITVSGSSMSSSLRRNASLLLIALTGALAVGYLFVGAYQVSRHRGLDNAEATLAALWACGLLFVLTVVTKLVTA